MLVGRIDNQVPNAIPGRADKQIAAVITVVTGVSENKNVNHAHLTG